MARKTLKVELGVLDRSFPRGALPIETHTVSSEEVTFRFTHSSVRLRIQCNLPVSVGWLAILSCKVSVDFI